MPKNEYQKFISKNAHQILNHHKKMRKYPNRFLGDCEFPDKIWQTRDSQWDVPDAMRNGLEMELVEAKTAINQLLQEKAQLEVQMQNLSKDLGDYRSKLGRAKADVKGSVLNEARAAVKDLADAKLAAEVSRQLRIHLRAEQEG